MIKTVRAFMYSVGADGITSQPVQFSFGGNNTDGETPVTSGILDVENYPLLYNRATGLFDRASALPDNSDVQAMGTAGLQGVVARTYLYNGAGGWNRPISSATSIDALSTADICAFNASKGYKFNGATWDRERTPNTFKGITTAAAGATAVWTPAAGKKFRLMRYMIQFSPDATLAVAGAITATLQDGATNLPFFLRSYYTAAIAANAPIDNSGWIDLGNGYLSAAANNVLNINLSVALATGVCSVFAIGTEE